MPVRIHRISIMREGPLREDLELEPSDLNLIYGRNETGKTYILEAMLSLLFRTGRDTPWISRWTRSRSATVRDWEPRGEIEVTGLEEGTTVFSAGSPRMEDLTTRSNGMPAELSRLIVVRAGDTRLSGSRDGVGDEVLRTYLSGNRVLDDVEENIRQETVKNAVITDGRIEAENKGLCKDRLTLESEIRYLDELRLVIDENASLIELNSLERRKKGLEDQLGELEDAKRHRAFTLYEEQRRLSLQLDALPSEEDMIRLGTDISLYRSRARELDQVGDRLTSMSSSEDDMQWLNQARDEYLAGSGVAGENSFGNLWRYLSLLFVLIAAAGSFISRWVTVTGAVLAAACITYLLRGRSSGPPPDSLERDRRLEEEFKRRFGRELRDSATLSMVHRELESQAVQLAGTLESRDRTASEKEEIGRRVSSSLYLLAGREVPPEEWDDVMEEFRASRKKTQEELSSLSSIIATLGISPADSLPEYSGREWDHRSYIDLREELEALQQEVERERKNLEDLKVDISVATGTSSRDIRQLITALEDRRRELVTEYRRTTSRILAENTVYRAIRQFREQENARLGQALDSPRIATPLYRITGKYNGVRMTDEGDLCLRTEGKGEFPLYQLSTGAAEQVYMALRTGFASLALGEPAFLLLDDAFQHSDWDRRKNLVDHVTALVEDGWQVFYFTMDEHLRKLMDGRGRELGSRRYLYLGLD